MSAHSGWSRFGAGSVSGGDLVAGCSLSCHGGLAGENLAVCQVAMVPQLPPSDARLCVLMGGLQGGWQVAGGLVAAVIRGMPARDTQTQGRIYSLYHPSHDAGVDDNRQQLAAGPRGG